MENLKELNSESETRMMVAKGLSGEGERGEMLVKVETFNYKMNRL